MSRNDTDTVAVKQQVEFYLLAMSQNHVSLYKAVDHKLQELEIENLPKNIREAIGSKSIEKQLQRHSGAGSSESVFHGHFGDTDFEKNNLEKYLRRIEKAVAKFLVNSEVPLVLAGVERVCAEYRHLDTYKYTQGEYVLGSPDRSTRDSMYQKAHEIINRSECSAP